MASRKRQNCQRSREWHSSNSYVTIIPNPLPRQCSKPSQHSLDPIRIDSSVSLVDRRRVRGRYAPVHPPHRTKRPDMNQITQVNKKAMTNNPIPPVFVPVIPTTPQLPEPVRIFGEVSSHSRDQIRHNF
ncbi:hypothetical protein VTJ04DRAFT_9334 [Mycothermus thermophilus]|uniref:uncharacterized protein n=1 Tax=Humicola insolens TaxID=85995 RepID=UPI003743CB90